MNRMMSGTPIINSKRQPKSLLRILSRSKFDMEEQQCRITKCGRSRCKTCPSLIEGESFKFTNGKSFKVKNTMNCVTKNVIYSLICPKCGQFYIGQTKNELCLRMNLHRQQTNNEEHRFLKVNRHLHECASGRFNVFSLYKVTNSSDSFGDEIEQRLINVLNPELNA